MHTVCWWSEAALAVHIGQRPHVQEVSVRPRSGDGLCSQVHFFQAVVVVLPKCSVWAYRPNPVVARGGMRASYNDARVRSFYRVKLRQRPIGIALSMIADVDDDQVGDSSSLVERAVPPLPRTLLAWDLIGQQRLMPYELHGNSTFRLDSHVNLMGMGQTVNVCAIELRRDCCALLRCCAPLERGESSVDAACSAV